MVIERIKMKILCAKDNGFEEVVSFEGSLFIRASCGTWKAYNADKRQWDTMLNVNSYSLENAYKKIKP